MPRRKDRISVVFDTNIFITAFTSLKQSGASARVVRLWRVERQLQLIVSRAIVEEYLEVLERKRVAPSRIERFALTLASPLVTHVKLGRRTRLSRDPDDDVMLDTALSGGAAYIVTHDNDLLDIPITVLRPFRFRIVRARELLNELNV